MVRDELYWLTTTIVQEAGAEPYLGKLAVACVVMTRARATGASVSDTVLQPKQFSCWDSRSPTRRMLDRPEDEQFIACYKAACAAYFDLVPDPTFRANHYLNPAAVTALPSWYAKDKITTVIGRHEFLRLP